MSARLLLIGPIVIPIAVAALLAMVRDRLGRLFLDAVAAVTAGFVVSAGAALVALTGRERAVSWLGDWRPVRGFSVGIPLVADRASAMLVLSIGVLVLAGLVFSWRYFDSASGFYHPLVLVFCAAMCGFVLTGDLFNMFVFFELMGVVAYTLTALHTEEERPLVGALNFAIVNSVGAFSTLTGIALIYARTGQLAFAGLGSALVADRPAGVLVVTSFALVAAGWLVKASVVPFHFWTADAEAVAPTPVCVLFSCGMVELGLYGVARLYWSVYEPVLPHATVRGCLLSFATVTALLGAVMCFAQHHLKRLLAYSTISHVGLMLVGIALVSPDGLAGAGIYAIGHAGVKGALFLCTGVLLQRFSTVSERDLHGRGRRMPVVAAVWFFAGLGLAGLPPFATALGKSVVEDDATRLGYTWVAVVFVLAEALTGGAVLRTGLRIFLGVGRPAGRDASTEETDEEVEESDGPRRRSTPVVMVLPAAVLAIGGFAAALVPGLAHGARVAAGQFVDRRAYAGAVLGATRRIGHQVVSGSGYSPAAVATSLLAVALAAAITAVALWPDVLPVTARRWWARAGIPSIAALRRVHTGHVGDYVAWLALGVAVLAGGLVLSLP